VIVLEFSQPTNPLIRFGNDLYCKRIMPHTATWLSGDKSGAYKYLPMSVATFMSREQMKQMLRDAGFVDVTEHPMTFGVAVVYRGYKR
jgi:demethylmenaquinone methyltransferase/2-methoxy-6-polyprenyl-1,4-benzoquinol methylase